MAVERDWTQVLDILNEKQLNMTSLNYSLQGGYWLESVFLGWFQQKKDDEIYRICLQRKKHFRKVSHGRDKSS